MTKTYYLVDADWVNEELKDAKESLDYCQSHGTGMDDYRGELKARIKILTKISESNTMNDG